MSSRTHTHAHSLVATVIGHNDHQCFKLRKDQIVFCELFARCDLNTSPEGKGPQHTATFSIGKKVAMIG